MCNTGTQQSATPTKSADGIFRPRGPAGRNPIPSGGRKLGAADGSSVRGTEVPSRRAPSGGRRPPSAGRSSAGRSFRPPSVRRTELPPAGRNWIPSGGRSTPSVAFGFRRISRDFGGFRGERGDPKPYSILSVIAINGHILERKMGPGMGKRAKGRVFLLPPRPSQSAQPRARHSLPGAQGNATDGVCSTNLCLFNSPLVCLTNCCLFNPLFV